MSARSTRVARGVRQVALTLGAVVGVLCILVTIAAASFGVRPLVFRSGSMGPTIDTGALAIAREAGADDLRLGDIVSVPTPSGERVTHRIASVEHIDGQAVLRLKGDANDAVDVSPYLVDHADVVMFSVPEVGYALGWLASPLGIFVLGVYAAYLVSVVVRGATGRRSAPEVVAPEVVPGRRRRSGARHRAARPSLVLAFAAVLPHRQSVGRHRLAPPAPSAARHRLDPPVVEPRRRSDARHRVVRPAVSLPYAAISVGLTTITLAAGTLAQGWTEPTQAAFTDPVVVSGTTQTAYTVPAPNGNTCALLTPGTSSSRGVNLSWPANVAPLPLLSYTPVVTGLTGATTAVTDVGSNKQLQVRYNPSSAANQNKTVTVTVTPRLTNTATWTGPVTTWKFRTGAASNVQPVCGEATSAVVEIRAPDGATRTPTAERAFISGATGCTADVGFCGTIADASTISSVTYVLKRVQGTTTRCFDGGAWVASCNQITAQSTTYQGLLTFYEDANTATVYPNTGTGAYTLTVTVTDSWANVTTTVVTFTLN